MGLFNEMVKATDKIYNNKTKSIAKAKLLGIRTAQQTKALATYNFSVYSFWVEYTDGSTETLELSSDDKRAKPLIDRLITFANSNEIVSNSGQDNNNGHRNDSVILADLKNIKELFDQGVIDSELYEKKKNAFLEELNREEETKQKLENNLEIRRDKKRAWGEAKIVVILDAQTRKDIDIDNPFHMFLPAGTHTISFKRGVVQTNELSFQASDIEVTKIVVSTYGITITADIFHN